MTSRILQAWTDNPIEALGDAPNAEAPIRPCRVLAYDGNKYLAIEVDGVRDYIKSGYVYTRKGKRLTDERWRYADALERSFRLAEGGEMRHAPCLTVKQLRALPRCS